MLRTGFLAVLYFIHGFRLRTMQRFQLLVAEIDIKMYVTCHVAKIDFGIVQILSDRFLQKQPGGIQHLGQR
jgi:hypothetical protein